jgi:hypothetical protein
VSDINGLNGIRLDHSTGTAYSGFGLQNTDTLITAGDAGGTANTNLLFRTAVSGSEATRMRLDSSGNLLVGTTDTTLYNNSDGSEGVRIAEDHVSIASNARTVFYVNRQTSDGEIIDIRKDGTTVGSIGAYSSRMYLGTGDTGVFFDSITDDAIKPWNTSTNAGRDAEIDLGGSSTRFKDLYLSNGVDLNRVDGGTQVQVAMKQAGSLKTQLTSNFGDSNFYLYHQGGNRLVINSSGNVGIGLASPIDSKLVIVETPATIVSGNAIHGSTMKGLKLRTNANGDESVGVWFGTNGSHWSGISGQRKNASSTWGTDLRFYTHEDATADLTYTRERMRIDSAGNVGIGTTNPKQKLHVNGTMLAGQGATAGSVALYNEYNSGTGDYLANWGTQYSSAAAAMSYGVRSTSSGWLSTYDNFSGQRGTLLVDGELEYLSATSTSVGTAVGSVVTLTSRLKVDSNGRVIIGDQLNFSNRTDSSFIKGDDGTGEIGYYADQNHKFYVYEGSWKNTVEVLSTGQVRFQGDQTEGNGGYLSSWDDNSGVFSGGGYQTQSGFYWTSNRTSNMSCDSGQIMFYANYTGGTAGQVNSVTMRAKINDSSNSGDFYTNDGSVSSLSDSRLKTNIENLTDGLDILTQLRPVTFEYNDNSVDERGREQLGKADGITRYGFIAQEVESVAAQYVNTETGMIGGEEVDDLKSMSQTRLIPMLVKSIQEQQTIIESLEARITALES